MLPKLVALTAFPLTPPHLTLSFCCPSASSATESHLKQIRSSISSKTTLKLTSKRLHQTSLQLQQRANKLPTLFKRKFLQHHLLLTPNHNLHAPSPLFLTHLLLMNQQCMYSKRRRSNAAVILVRIVFIRSFLFYCLLFNHSFPTNPNKITNCFKLFSLYCNFTTTLLNASLFDF